MPSGLAHCRQVSSHSLRGGASSPDFACQCNRASVIYAAWLCPRKARIDQSVTASTRICYAHTDLQPEAVFENLPHCTLSPVGRIGQHQIEFGDRSAGNLEIAAK